ncbi:MAG TPA: MerR family transcriptional regulator [Blastocatellia bacterium]|nr:MerR family transcriptional regulator [Blastocatellia bacterium]
MKDSIRNLKAQKYVGTAQLADEAARLISRFVPKQERGSVSELPDERMVRYYSAEGLISPPEGKQGPAAVYGYSHLLQLLVVKRLQAEHLPIRKIKELVGGKSERELEQLLDIDKQRVAQKNPATEYLESLLRSAAPRAAARMQAPAASPPVGFAAAQKSAWARVEIEPGLELHIREDYQLPADTRERQRLARRMLNEIENHGVKPRK